MTTAPQTPATDAVWPPVGARVTVQGTGTASRLDERDVDDGTVADRAADAAGAAAAVEGPQDIALDVALGRDLEVDFGPPSSHRQRRREQPSDSWADDGWATTVRATVTVADGADPAGLLAGLADADVPATPVTWEHSAAGELAAEARAAAVEPQPVGGHARLAGAAAVPGRDRTEICVDPQPVEVPASITAVYRMASRG